MKSCSLWIIIIGYFATVAGVHYLLAPINPVLGNLVIVVAAGPIFFCLVYPFWIWIINSDKYYARTEISEAVRNWENKRKFINAKLRKIDKAICPWA